MKKTVLLSCLFFLLCASADAQLLKTLGQRVKQKINERIERKTDEATDKGLDKVEDAANHSAKKDKKSKQWEAVEKGGIPVGSEIEKSAAGNTNNEVFSSYSKFDFVSGNRILFYDDFSADHTGDFPSKWNTNGSGEVVQADDEAKYFQLRGGSLYLPAMQSALPDEFTVEFDLKTSGLTDKISSVAYLDIILDNNRNFQQGDKRAVASLSFCQYNPDGLTIHSEGGDMGKIRNVLREDYRQEMKQGAHISIAVNKKRFRLWVNARKLVDAPTFLPPGASYLKFYLRGFDTDYKLMKVFIGNVKIAAGGEDLRSKLITEGHWSTTGILFNVNSSEVRPESYGVLKEIAEVLKNNPKVKVKIIGHTDSDGDENSNLKLSQNRAASVKTILTKKFGIDNSRMTTEGKGESSPVADNSTAKGKAQNRRVEFVKL